MFAKAFVQILADKYIVICFMYLFFVCFVAGGILV